jgi:hypothetical protein
MQYFTVVEVRWTDRHARVHDVVLRAASNQTFQVQLEGHGVRPGQRIRVASFYFIDDGDAGLLNPRTSVFEQADNGAFRASGRVISLDHGDAIVDCLGLVFRVSNVGNDEKLIGTFVSFSGQRIEADVDPVQPNGEEDPTFG